MTTIIIIQKKVKHQDIITKYYNYKTKTHDTKGLENNNEVNKISCETKLISKKVKVEEAIENALYRTF